MMKFVASTVLGLFVIATAPAFAQSGLPEIEKRIREQEAKLATVRLGLLHMEITHATGRAIDVFQRFRSLEKKIQNLSRDEATFCAQLPGLRYAHTLLEMQASAAQVGALLAQAPTLIEKGGNPTEGMKKLLQGDLAKIMRSMVSDTANLQSLFSDLETSCSKEG